MQPVRNSLLSRHKRAARRRALRFIASDLRPNMLGAGWAARLPQPAPVQAAVLNRLAHVFGLEAGRAVQVGDRAGDLENAVIGAGRQAEPRDRGAQQRVGAVRQAAEGARSEEHTSELQSLAYLVCRLLLEKKKA